MSQDEDGLRRLFRQFSTPGGIPSHVSVTTPGSIHEGGELGYVLVHAFGAAFDNPDLIVVAVVGDGEAETGPLEGGWKGISFLNPARDGAVLPILHLNGYKIAGPTVLGRSTDEEIRQLLAGHGYEGFFVEGDDPLPRPPGVRRDARQLLRADPGRSRRRARRRGVHEPPALAGHRAAHAEGLDRAEGRRRPADRGHVPRASGAARRGQGQPRAPRDPRDLDAELPARGAVRRRRPAPARAGGPGPHGRSTHGRQPARQRRQGSSWTSICRTSATTRSR